MVLGLWGWGWCLLVSLLRFDLGMGQVLWMGVSSLDRYPILKVEGGEVYGLAY